VIQLSGRFVYPDDFPGNQSVRINEAWLYCLQHKEQEYIWFKGGDLNSFRGIQQFPISGGGRMGLTPGAISIASNIQYMYLKISCQYFLRLYEEMLKFDFCIICFEWPWTFQNDLEWPWSTTLSLKEDLLSTTSISDEMFRRYELGRIDGHNGDSMLPRIFFGDHQNEYWYMYAHYRFHSFLEIVCGLTFFWSPFLWSMSFSIQVFENVSMNGSWLLRNWMILHGI
jgi:hypothetical protein